MIVFSVFISTIFIATILWNQWGRSIHGNLWIDLSPLEFLIELIAFYARK